jgi:hypothetical protein
MRVFRSARFLILALLVCLIPASSFAGVFISVGFAPPILPVYVQPPCPEPGLMWTPGYWGYGDDGYYWVPGTWVPAPYVGALWTPGYWGWGGGLYAWHPGYWGPHVGYYGGVNYGFGYMGVGFAGGMWRGGVFAYNTAVMRVGAGPGWGGNRVYVDNTIVHNTTIVNNHVAYSGGPGGVNHPPSEQENAYSHEQHMAATNSQMQHENAARGNANAYASHSGGHPSNVAMARPMGGGGHAMPSGGGGAGRGNMSPENHAYTPSHGSNPQPESHSQPQSHPQPQSHQAPAQHSNQHPEGHEHEH